MDYLGWYLSETYDNAKDTRDFLKDRVAAVQESGLKVTEGLSAVPGAIVKAGETASIAGAVVSSAMAVMSVVAVGTIGVVGAVYFLGGPTATATIIRRTLK